MSATDGDNDEDSGSGGDSLPCAGVSSRRVLGVCFSESGRRSPQQNKKKRDAKGEINAHRNVNGVEDRRWEIKIGVICI